MMTSWRHCDRNIQTIRHKFALNKLENNFSISMKLHRRLKDAWFIVMCWCRNDSAGRRFRTAFVQFSVIHEENHNKI